MRATFWSPPPLTNSKNCSFLFLYFNRIVDDSEVVDSTFLGCGRKLICPHQLVRQKRQQLLSYSSSRIEVELHSGVARERERELKDLSVACLVCPLLCWKINSQLRKEGGKGKAPEESLKWRRKTGHRNGTCQSTGRTKAAKKKKGKSCALAWLQPSKFDQPSSQHQFVHYQRLLAAAYHHPALLHCCTTCLAGVVVVRPITTITIINTIQYYYPGQTTRLSFSFHSELECVGDFSLESRKWRVSLVAWDSELSNSPYLLFLPSQQFNCQPGTTTTTAARAVPDKDDMR